MASYKLSQRLWAAILVVAMWAGCLSVATTSATASDFHALVIGVERYERAPDLRNPARDAQAVGARLQALGYTLYGGEAHIDQTREAMLALMRGFAADVPDNATALVFFAGHGVSSGGDSYLIPADDRALETRSDLSDHAVALRSLTGRLAARTGVHSVVIVDACRANGLRGDGPAGAGGAGVGGAGDLVPSPTGSMSLIYAAAPGQIAADGDRLNSPFTAALLAALEMPEQPLSDLFRVLAGHMRDYADSTQTPWMQRSYGVVAPVFLSASD